MTRKVSLEQPASLELGPPWGQLPCSGSPSRVGEVLGLQSGVGLRSLESDIPKDELETATCQREQLRYFPVPAFPLGEVGKKKKKSPVNS